MKLSEDGIHYSLINNKPFYGTDGEIPKEKISVLTIQINNQIQSINPEYYNDLFDPNINFKKGNSLTKGYITESGEIIIQVEGQGGAGFYYAIFIIDKTGKFKRRIVKSLI